MRSIERRFIEMSKRHPDHSTFVCFGHAVRHQEFTRDMMSWWFKKLVDPEDYEDKYRSTWMDHFDYLTNMPVEE